MKLNLLVLAVFSAVPSLSLAAAKPQQPDPGPQVASPVASPVVSPITLLNVPQVYSGSPHIQVIVDPPQGFVPIPIPQSTAKTDLGQLLQPDLESHLVTASQGRFLALDNPGAFASLCPEDRVHLVVNVTDLSLDNDQLGLSVGYSAGGILNVVGNNVSGNASVTLHIGNLRIDFALQTCNARNECTTLITTQFNATTSSLNGEVKVSWGNFGPDLTGIMTTQFPALMGQAFDQGISAMLGPQYTQIIQSLPWHAEVTQVDSAANGGLVHLNVGSAQGIGTSQLFELSKHDPVSCVEISYGTIQTQNSFNEDSSAQVTAIQAPNVVQSGDYVRVHSGQ